MVEKLKREGGLRMTKQRQHVLEVLRSRCDHPTASEVFLQVRDEMPTISLATVYNCLEVLHSHGLVNAIHLTGGGPSRYCANPQRHAHFHCTECAAVFDIQIPRSNDLVGLLELPAEAILTEAHLTLDGVCPECASQSDDS